MSFQAIIDNFAGPQIADLQLSNTIKESQKTSNSSSFFDLLTSYKEESKVEEKSVEKNIEKSVENTKVNDTDKETDKKSEDKIVKNESSDVQEEKTEETKEIKTNESEKTSSKILAKKTEGKETKSEEKKVTSKENKKITEKENLKNSKETKLNNKDFARINEIESQNTEKLQDNSSVKNAENLDLVKVKNDDVKQNNENVVIDLQNQTQNVENLQMTVKNQTNDEEESVDFDFKKEGSKNKNVAKLDKDGKISVEDLRTEKVEQPSKNEKSHLKVTDVKFDDKNNATITMDLNQADANVLSLNDQSASSQGSNFQSMLNNQIQANVPEFVKAGSIVLKDNDQGTINLVIHPDDLGNVKIHLSMDGKTVTGHITVATKEALQVFKDNAETMREAFIKNGFENANFDVSYGNTGSGNQGMNFEQQQDGSNLFANHVYGSVNGSEISDTLNNDFIENEQYFNDFSINIVA